MVTLEEHFNSHLILLAGWTGVVQVHSLNCWMMATTCLLGCVCTTLLRAHVLNSCHGKHPAPLLVHLDENMTGC